MKKTIFFYIVFVFIISMSTLVFAQNTHTIDFETGGVGADWNWTMAENDDNPPLEFIANPVSGGLNTSATVAKFTARLTGQPWALCHTSDDGVFTFDANNSIVTIMIYKSVVSDVGLKFEGQSGNHQIVIPNTVTDQWEEMTFDFSSQIGSTYGTIVLIPDFDLVGRTQENIIYFDNIQAPDGDVTGPLPEPTVAAPTPSVPAADVISIFSDAYTDIAGTNFNPGWGQTTVVTTEEIGGNFMMKYDNFNYQGTEFAGAQDLSSMNYMHIDMWTPNATVVKVTPISASTGENLAYLAPITLESWNSYDIPLADFAGVSMADIVQLKFDGQVGVTPSILYLDNIYFYSSTAPSAPTVAAPTPTVPAADVISVFSDAYTDIAGTNFNPGWGQTTVVTTEEIGGNFMMKYDVFNYQGTEFAGAQDLSSMDFMHIDMWTSDATVVKVTPISASTGENLAYLEPITLESWNSYDIPVADFAGVSMSDIVQLKFDGQEGITPSTIYLDNIYFYSSGITALTLPVEEGFEGGVLPDDWTNEYVANATDWEFTYGVNSTHPADPHGGAFNAYFNGDTGDITKLVTPQIDMDTATDATLTFWHVQEEWSPDQDFLRVYYKNSAAGDWVMLAEYVDELIDWTEETIGLPELSGDYYIAFEADDEWGYGIGLDDISITEGAPVIVPTEPAPTPTVPADDVISLFSNVYTNVPVDTWSAEWDQADVEDIQIAGNDTKLYTNLVFAGIEFTSQTIDASAMSNFVMDFWTPDPTAAPAVFKIKLVDFGADGAWGGGDDVEHELIFDETTTPALASETWVHFNIPMSDFTGLTTTGHLAQLIISGDPNTVYIDNVYFFDNGVVNPFDPPENVAVNSETGLATWTPPAASISSDDFDSYTVGGYIAEQGELWTTWSNAPGGSEDTIVSDAQAASPSNSMLVELNNDMVYIMENYTTGIYSMDIDMYVPTGFCGYYNMQKTSTPGEEWAFQAYFQTDGHAIIDAGAAAAVDFNFFHDEWFDLRLVIDLDNDWCDFYFNGELKIGYQWTLGTFGTAGLNQLGGMNIFGGANSTTTDTPMFYVDNVDFKDLSAPADPMTGYNVYLDGMFEAYTTDEFYQYTGLNVNQTYMAGVSAVYDDPGESDIVEYEFTYIPANVLPPNNLAAEVVDYNSVELTWELPGGASEEILYHGPYDNNGIGTGAAADFINCARFTAEELADYYGGWSITGVNIFLHSMDFSYVGIQVYEGGSMGDPGTLVYDQDITASAVAIDWTPHLLSTPVPLVAGNEYWIGYDLSATADHPAAVDAGPMVADKGAWLYFSGAWDTLLGLGLDYNWMITGIVSQQDQVASNGTKKSAVIGNSNVRERIHTANIEAPFEAEFTHKVRQTEPAQTSSRSLAGYKVYRDGIEIAEIFDPATLSYSDECIDAGNYEYYVTAIYTNPDDESEPSNLVDVEITLPAPTGLTATSNWPNILITWSAMPGVESYNLYQDGALVTNSTSTFYLHANIPAGTYVYNVAAVFCGGYEGEWSSDNPLTHEDPNSVDPNLIPLVTSLDGNYPNPFNPTTMIKFALHEDAKVAINVYNIKGEKVRTLVNGELEAAYHSILWNGADDNGKTAASGVYFYKMKAGKFVSTKKMILMK